MFHVKQHSLYSFNLQGFVLYFTHVTIKHPISFPLPREGIKGRGREVVYVPRETFSPLFSEK